MRGDGGFLHDSAEAAPSGRSAVGGEAGKLAGSSQSGSRAGKVALALMAPVRLATASFQPISMQGTVRASP